MTDADFLHDILASPADDGPRLVYADWLDEHGRPERAEFIRVQCELAGFTNPEPSLPHNRDRLAALRRRERELLDGVCGLGVETLAVVEGLTRSNLVGRGGYGWYPRDDTSPQNGIEAEFRRGFVYRVTLTAEAWQGGPCGRCYGCGRVRYPDTEDDEPDDHCPDCRGSGRTPGHADALVAACPLEAVTLTTWPEVEEYTPAYYRSGRTYRLRGGRKRLSWAAPVPEETRVAMLLAAEWKGITFTLPREIVEQTYLGEETDLTYGGGE